MVFDCRDHSPVHIFLEKLASKAGTDFLSHVSLPEEELVRPPNDQRALCGTMEMVWNDYLPSADVPMWRWGLNE